MNDKKSKQLEMKYGTANGQLRKSIMFFLLQRLKDTACYRCGEQIKSAKDLSIDHKIPWLGNSNKLFWDVKNIAFSHSKCNSAAARRPQKDSIAVKRAAKARRIVSPAGFSWCSICKKHLPVKNFNPSKDKWNGLWWSCKSCDYSRDSK